MNRRPAGLFLNALTLAAGCGLGALASAPAAAQVAPERHRSRALQGLARRRPPGRCGPY
ncbi:hypothetical protein LP415_24335 [Polaromonas sp. P1(28)-8]|nr:hypothetical protein LP415_24335 [Polaromonas sp. P1(28)-8]